MRSSLYLSVLFVGLLDPRFAFPQDAMDLGFEAGTPGKIPEQWFVHTKGWSAELSAEKAAEGSLSAKLHLTETSTEPFGNLMRRLNATEYRGKHAVLRARLFVQGVGLGRAQMWLRVDRENGEMGAFDNMGRRPIPPGDWTDAVIETDIDVDAKTLNIGFMSISGATVFIDAVRLTVSDKITLKPQAPSAARALSSRELENLTAAARLLSYVRFFHPSDQAVGVIAWEHFAIDLMERAEPAKDAADLAKRLTEAFAPIAPTLRIWSGSSDHAPLMPPLPEGATGMASWKHFGAGTIASGQGGPYTSNVERTIAAANDSEHGRCHVVKALGGGVSCRLPVQVYADGEGTLPHGKTPDEWAKTHDKLKLTALNRSTRLAGVALGWGVFQHFYPYFDEVNAEWDAALPTALKHASEDVDEISYLKTLQEMIAHLHDGHGIVNNTSLNAPTSLPLSLGWAGSELVVVGASASVGDTVKLGDVILSIDGRSTEECYRHVSKWISASSDGWRRWQSAYRIAIILPTDDPAKLTLRRLDGSVYSVSLARAKEPPMGKTKARPENAAELAPGIVYFNLVQTTTDDLNKAMSKLEQARGIIFDLRGYPFDGAYELMQHLIDAPATSARWIVPIVRRPDREDVEWSERERWALLPKTPRLKGRIAFLTDGRAISYAESIMGIVEHYKFGEIVGSTTAGTNGNVNPFTLPGGFEVMWTGMKVLKHDGSRHHGVGIAPTVPVVPTAAGIAAGKDEVLDKAVEVLKSKLSANDSGP